jgi:16S rRNA (adenine1518-N6/adenine1519-N6)-dimethyltransferase
MAHSFYHAGCVGRRYGQHFLSNPRAIASIVAAFAPGPADHVVEIGAGRGALTRRLAGGGGPLLAVEIDRALAQGLSAELGLPLIEGIEELRRLPGPAGGAILLGDALELDYGALASAWGVPEGARLRVVGNLPYAVATALVQRMARERDRVADAVVMVQREVARRLLASPGERDYGILAVLISLTAERRRILSLGPGSFSPPPKVDSTVVGLRFRTPERPAFRAEDERLLALLKAAFSERRKKIAGNLAKRFSLERASAVSLLAACGIDPGARPEAVAPEAYRALAARIGR